MPNKIQFVVALIILFRIFTANMTAQTNSNENQNLSVKQKSIVAIAALTAKGDLAKLEKAIGSGLNSGLTVNEIKEVMVHLYAYCGFPRSLNGLIL